jgi:dTDP-3-amino-3,4,6-trideoxy-alpha-D-glucose transaminase
MYGWRERYVSELHSTVSRLDELQAAVLSVKLAHLDAWNVRRQAIARRYRAGLDGVVDLPPSEGVFHLFVIRTPQRDALKAHLAERGIETSVHYPVPVHVQAPYVPPEGLSLPRTEQLAREVLSLPMYPELRDDDVDHVIECIRSFQAHRGA